MVSRVDPHEFRELDLRSHELLADVPLHDVWAIELQGGGPDRSIEDVRAILFGRRSAKPNLAVQGLFAARTVLGRTFGWDKANPKSASASFVHRLTEDDRARSKVAPGTSEGSFRVLYAFEHEAVNEIMNKTVHGFLTLALVPKPGGYVLYAAIHVLPIGKLTAVYMALIDPFRRFIVYPALGKQAQTTWSREFNQH